MENAENCSNIIKLRGLPWNVCPQDILDFLKNVEVSGGENGIHLITSPRDGRPNGEAFVECASEKDFNEAFEYNKKVMGHRYIESKSFFVLFWFTGCIIARRQVFFLIPLGIVSIKKVYKRFDLN